MAHTLPQNGELSYPPRIVAGISTRISRRDLFAGAVGAHLGHHRLPQPPGNGRRPATANCIAGLNRVENIGENEAVTICVRLSELLEEHLNAIAPRHSKLTKDTKK